jgi:hypothetical protein
MRERDLIFFSGKKNKNAHTRLVEAQRSRKSETPTTAHEGCDQRDRGEAATNPNASEIQPASE